MASSKKSVVFSVMAVVGLALGTVPVIAVTGCGSPTGPDCQGATSSIDACYDCVGIERVEGGILTPCSEFRFALNETCTCT